MRKEERVKHRYTDAGICVDDRIEKGLTAFFTNEAEARAHASTKRSYHYPIFTEIRRLIGFGVPK